MKCLIYEMNYLLNVLFMKCPIYEMFIYEMSVYEMSQHSLSRWNQLAEANLPLVLSGVSGNGGTELHKPLNVSQSVMPEP